MISFVTLETITVLLLISLIIKELFFINLYKSIEVNIALLPY